VFANPGNAAAKALLADTYEQLGYQSEAGPWRAVYLQGAYELRNGLPKAAGKKIFLNVDFTDLKKSKATLDAIQLRDATIESAIAKGDLKITGRREAFSEFMALLDTFPFWFNIVTP
jgi:alkyl sulfatase BDS1-like metallo-beta-lactamase superfamily hydrolase